MRPILLCFLLLSSLAVPAEAEEQVVFQLEPERGMTFSHTGELEAGSEVLLEISNLPHNQRFLAKRCGRPCNTAETVFTAVGRDRPVMNRSFGIETTARYYFFLQRKDESGATGPVGITSFHPRDDGFEATFASGATVRGRVRETRRPGRAADSTPPNGDSVEVLTVSPQPLTRGVPTEVTVDVRVTLETQFEGRVGIGFSRDAPGRFTHVDQRAVEAGTQDLTLIVDDVVPVDWGERGAFAVGVHLLPATHSLGRVQPLASDTEALEVVP